ncbi:MAG: insulinase family protein [Planctomycetes bacterium]|nr:insulinase family protein [Planctomycetota bacterium]
MRPLQAASLLVLGLAGCSGPAPQGSAAGPAPVAVRSDIPGHPDQLKYPSLRFEVPDAAALRTLLSTGTPAYLIEDPSLPIVDLRISIRGGSFDEPAGKAGLADLTADLLRTGGTTTRDPNAVDEEIDFLAANVAIGVEDVSGSATLSILSKDLDKGLVILMDLLRNPLFRQDKLDTLKAQTLDGLKSRNDRTSSIEAREANLLFYGADYPINRIATKASIESITREDLKAFHASWIRPSRFIVSAAGAFRKAELVAKLEAAFKEWPAAPAVVGPVTAPKPTHEPKPSIYCFNKEGKNITQGRVTFGHRGVDIHHPDVQAIRVMSYILGAGGFSSHLMQRVRTQEGLAYDVRSDLRPGLVYPFPFRIVFQSKNESCAYAGKLCLEEIQKIRTEGVTAEELKAAQQFYLDAFPGLFFSTKMQIAGTYAQAELLGLPKDYYSTYREKIAKLTPEDIRRVAREQLHPEKFAWVVVGNIAAIQAGDGVHPVKLADLGEVVSVPLADPFTLERMK